MSSSFFSLTAQLLAAFNQTIAHGLLRSIQKTNAKLEQLEESLISSSENPSGKQAKSFPRVIFLILSSHFLFLSAWILGL